MKIKKIVTLTLVVAFMFISHAYAGIFSKKKEESKSNFPSKSGVLAPSSKFKAPDFKLKMLDGKSLTLQQFEGKVIVLDFWATWCPPCVAEIPHFIELQKKYGPQGVQFIGIALDYSAEPVKKFIIEKKTNYPIAMGTQELVKLYGGVNAIPTTFILDRDHTIVTKLLGYQNPSVLEEFFKKLL